MNWIDEVNFNEEGLVPVIVQDVKTSRVLMLGWANREALESTVATGRGVYFSRSRGQVWCKGESSGNHQVVVGMQLATGWPVRHLPRGPAGRRRVPYGTCELLLARTRAGRLARVRACRARARGHVRKMTSSRVEILEFVKMRGNPPFASKPIPK